MLKKLLFTLFSVFLAWQTCKLMTLLLQNESWGISWIQVLFLAFLINLYVTGVFAFPGFVFSTSKLIPSGYYTIRFPKTIQTIHRLLGVKYFRAGLMLFYWGKHKNRSRFFDGKRSGIQQMDFQTRQAEFGHLGAFISIGVLSLTLLFSGRWQLALVSTILNIIANLYPVILQRNHRIRIERLKSKV